MSGEKKPDEIWHWTDGVYRLVNITPVRREVEREVVVDGKKTIERSMVEYTVCNAEKIE